MNAEVIKEEPLSAVDAGKRVRDFLRRRHVTELLSTEDYSRLYGLQEALLEQEESEAALKQSPKSPLTLPWSRTERKEDADVLTSHSHT